MQQERLLRGEGPVIRKALVQVGRAEIPVGGIPGRAFPCGLVRAGRDVPALHHLLQEAPFKQPLPMRAGQIARADRDQAARLEGVQRFERLREFFRRSGHGVFFPARFSFRVLFRL